MELFNYVRNSGYERESPFVNDVKFHPVLKAKKSFTSGILAAFMSTDTNQPAKPSEVDNTPRSPMKHNPIPTTSESSFFGLLKKKVALYICLLINISFHSFKIVYDRRSMVRKNTLNRFRCVDDFVYSYKHVYFRK